jgi:hypothetical protein
VPIPLPNSAKAWGMEDNLRILIQSYPAYPKPRVLLVTIGSLNKIQLGQKVRSHVREQLYDESGVSPHGVAIYILSDPRSIRDVRYVGQTSFPARRFLQHVNTAKLWLPDDLPWWVKSPKLRPLYCWIRELYADEHRLPVMVISAYADSVSKARVAERALIFECLRERGRLLNVEREILGRQIPLI